MNDGITGTFTDSISNQVLTWCSLCHMVRHTATRQIRLSSWVQSHTTHPSTRTSVTHQYRCTLHTRTCPTAHTGNPSPRSRFCSRPFRCTTVPLIYTRTRLDTDCIYNWSISVLYIHCLHMPYELQWPARMCHGGHLTRMNSCSYIRQTCQGSQIRHHIPSCQGCSESHHHTQHTCSRYCVVTASQRVSARQSCFIVFYLFFLFTSSTSQR